MSGLRIALLGFFAVAGSASAAVVPVPAVPGSTSTVVYGINDGGEVAGAFIDQTGNQHAFFGLPGGQYTTFDAGEGGTVARAIDNRGVIVGYASSQSGGAAEQPIFERKPNGQIQGVTRDGQQLFGFAYGIESGKDRFVGAWWSFNIHQAIAFRGRNGEWKSDVIVHDVHQASAAHGINSAGIVVGSYFRPPQRGFVVRGRKLTTVDYPSRHAVATELEAINDLGHATGQWMDDQGHTHSFLYDIATATFSDIHVRGAADVFAYGINGNDNVAVDTDIGAYVWCSTRAACRSFAK